METYLCLELLILLCVTYVRVSLCFNITVGFFRKVGQHQKLTMCANTLFRKVWGHLLKRQNESGNQHEYEEMRMHNETDVCEGLPRGGINKTMDNQYSYVKRLKTEHIFDPMLEYSSIVWKLPGLFRNGARLTVAGRMPEGYYMIDLNLITGTDGIIPLQLKMTGNFVTLNEYVHDVWHRRSTPGTFEGLTTGKAFRFAFVAEENWIMVFSKRRTFSKTLSGHALDRRSRFSWPCLLS